MSFMKCELCHQQDAETAIVVREKDEDRELYVCNTCAKRERTRRQKKSQRTRKAPGLPPGMSISVTRVGGGEPPPIIEAIMNAMQGVVDGLEKVAQDERPKKEPEYTVFPCARVESAYRIADRLHLEGLHLVGEMEAVQRAVHALDMKLEGFDVDGIRDTGHIYALKYLGPQERARRVVSDILAQERNARLRLKQELPRVFSDAICRALAVMKNCRLLSQGELFDLLSPLRLAAIEKMLEGVKLAEIDEWMRQCDLSPRGEGTTQEERDRADAELADELNARFEDVVLSERGEGMLP